MDSNGTNLQRDMYICQLTWILEIKKWAFADINPKQTKFGGYCKTFWGLYMINEQMRKYVAIMHVINTLKMSKVQ